MDNLIRSIEIAVWTVDGNLSFSWLSYMYSHQLGEESPSRWRGTTSQLKHQQWWTWLSPVSCSCSMKHPAEIDAANVIHMNRLTFLFFFSQSNQSSLFLFLHFSFSIQRNFWLLYTLPSPDSVTIQRVYAMHARDKKEGSKLDSAVPTQRTVLSLSLSFYFGAITVLMWCLWGGPGSSGVGEYPWGGLRWIYGETEGKRPRKRAAGAQYYRDVACWWSSTFHMQIQEAIKLLSSRVLLYLSFHPRKKNQNQEGTKSIGVDGEWLFFSSSFSSFLSALEIAFWTQQGGRLIQSDRRSIEK